MTSDILIDKDEQRLEIDIIKYRGIIGSLFYITENYLDIMFSVFICARFQASHRESHFKSVKCIFKYLNRTLSHSLWFSKDSECSFVYFSNSDFRVYKLDRKSTNGTWLIF